MVDSTRIEIGASGQTRPLSTCLVGMVRLELTHLSTPEPKSGAAANYATSPINTCVRRYQNLTPQGLNFYLSLSDIGVCYIIVYDAFNAEAQMRYFTNVNLALRYINNL